MPFMQTRGGGAPIGHRYKSSGGGFGSSSTNPAYSAWDVLNSDPSAPSGYYWIQPQHGGQPAKELWCDMTNYGGGWQLLSYIGAGTTWTVHWQDSPTSSEDNATPKFNASSSTMSATNQSSNEYGNMGRDYIAACVIAARSPGGVACYRIQYSGGTYVNFFHSVDGNSDYLPAIPHRDETNSFSDNLSGNNWYRTCHDGLTLDSGNGGAGTPSGTQGTYAYHRWGIIPNNLHDGMSHYNWGYSISPNHSSNTNYPACHNAGWNKDGNFWFKSMDIH